MLPPVGKFDLGSSPPSNSSSDYSFFFLSQNKCSNTAGSWNLVEFLSDLSQNRYSSNPGKYPIDATGIKYFLLRAPTYRGFGFETPKRRCRCSCCSSCYRRNKKKRDTFEKPGNILGTSWEHPGNFLEPCGIPERLEPKPIMLQPR